jgi:excisionase family DNA binding protein
MTIKEVADLIHMGRTAVWAAIVSRQEIPHYRLGERGIRVLRSDVQAYLEARRVGGR